jgi:hypothetical protein
VLRSLVNIVVCTRGQSWMATTLACFEGAHITLIVVGLLCALVFCFVAVLSMLVLVDTDPRSNDVTAKAHGRVDVVVMLCRVALIVLCTQADRLSIRVILGVALAVAAIQFLGYVYYLPYYQQGMNQWHAAGSAMFLSSVACRVLAEMQSPTVVRAATCCST